MVHDDILRRDRADLAELIQSIASSGQGTDRVRTLLRLALGAIPEHCIDVYVEIIENAGWCADYEHLPKYRHVLNRTIEIALNQRHEALKLAYTGQCDRQPRDFLQELAEVAA